MKYIVTLFTLLVCFLSTAFAGDDTPTTISNSEAIGLVCKYTATGVIKPILGHNIPLAALGVFILWVGWFGFNPGSTTAANKDIAMIFVNTNLAAAAGCIVAMFVSWFKFGKPEVGMSLNGALAGLVGITAGCANVTPSSAVIIGSVAGALVVFSVLFFDKIRIDDPVGAISVHGVCRA